MMTLPIGMQTHEMPIVTFPPGTLSEDSVRLPLLYEDADFFVVSKPSGISVRQHPWESGGNLDRALNDALQQGKQWAIALAATTIGSVFPLEQAISGPVLFAKNPAALARARNAYGSFLIEFQFWLIAQAREANEMDRELTCDIPLRAVAASAQLMPSRRRGKRSETHFKQLFPVRHGWSLWQASTLYPRMHQVRAHARQIGLAIAADPLYGTTQVPTTGDLRGKGSGPGLQKPLLSRPALHLHSIHLPKLITGRDSFLIHAPTPVNFNNCLRKAGWHGICDR